MDVGMQQSLSRTAAALAVCYSFNHVTSTIIHSSANTATLGVASDGELDLATVASEYCPGQLKKNVSKTFP